jgi:hypothetical protein
MPISCVDLRERFGEEYRITRAEAAESPNDPWMFTIPCQHCKPRGQYITIHPHGGELLAVEVNYYPSIARALARLGLTIHQDGGWNGEMTFLFHVDRFEEVAALVKPKRRKKLTPEQRQQGMERLARFRFRSARDSAGETPIPAEQPTNDPEPA